MLQMEGKPVTNILITGANGFVASGLLPLLRTKEYHITCVSRNQDAIDQLCDCSHILSTGEINTETRWDNILQGIDVIVHLAARVHVMNDTTSDPLEAFRMTNTCATKSLAAAAARQGVKRFVYLSSIKVNGEKTTVNKFNHDDKFIPDDPYALSKYEAEQLLLEISRQSELEVVIIRPPLVYGPGVKANFLRLLDLVKSGFPLPLSSIQNARSMVSLDNLSDFIVKCIEHPSAANQVFLVSDGNDLSTPELVRKIAMAMKKKPHMFSFPVKLLKSFSRLAGQGASVDRLVDSLQLNPGHSEYLLDWKPVQTTDEAIHKVVEWYLKR